MRSWRLFVLAVLAALLSVWALGHVLPEGWGWLLTVLSTVIVVSAGLGSKIVRLSRERLDGSGNEGSIERDLARQAAAGMFGSTLVAMVGFGLYLVIQRQFQSAVVLYLVVVLVIVGYWAKYAILRRQVT